MSCRVTKWSLVSLHKLASCISELWARCASRASRCLQLNATKTELIWFSSRAALQKLSANQSLMVHSTVIHPVGVVRVLRVLPDRELTMHINKLVSTCFYHIRWPRQLKCHVSHNMMKQVVSALIMSRLDYCNSFLVGLPWSSLAPLQCVQNAAARLVMGL